MESFYAYVGSVSGTKECWQLSLFTMEGNLSIFVMLAFGHESVSVDFEYFCALSMILSRLSWALGKEFQSYSK